MVGGGSAVMVRGTWRGKSLRGLSVSRNSQDCKTPFFESTTRARYVEDHRRPAAFARGGVTVI